MTIDQRPIASTFFCQFFLLLRLVIAISGAVFCLHRARSGSNQQQQLSKSHGAKQNKETTKQQRALVCWSHFHRDWIYLFSPGPCF